jgi:hypothetical protein
MSDERDKQWSSLYNDLGKSLALLGSENAFGDADYWIVDDDYGGTTHKLCVHKLAFLKPQLIAAIQQVLKYYPQWQVMVQLEIQDAAVDIPLAGVIVLADKVEQHWDRVKFAGLAKMLNL